MAELLLGIPFIDLGKFIAYSGGERHLLDEAGHLVVEPIWTNILALAFNAAEQESLRDFDKLDPPLWRP